MQAPGHVANLSSGDFGDAVAASETIVQLGHEQTGSRETKKALPPRAALGVENGDFNNRRRGRCTTFRNSGGGRFAGAVAVTCATETEGLAATCGVALTQLAAVASGSVSPATSNWRRRISPHHE